MNIIFERKLAIPMEVKEMYPLTGEMSKLVEARDAEMKAILSGNDDRVLLIVGPCSADNEDSVIDYISRLREVQEKVEEKIMIVPRIYTNKPRTTGDGYKGMLHQPNPSAAEDMLDGIISIRRIHTKAIEETGLFCADEMLYTENYRYLSDLLSYVAIGARSTENQEHRLVSSGLGINEINQVFDTLQLSTDYQVTAYEADVVGMNRITVK